MSGPKPGAIDNPGTSFKTTGGGRGARAARYGFSTGATAFKVDPATVP